MLVLMLMLWKDVECYAEDYAVCVGSMAGIDAMLVR